MNRQIAKKQDFNEALGQELLVLGKADQVFQICSRLGDLMEGEKLFKAITPQKMEVLASYMPEVNRATASFGRKNTQFQLTNMTLHMMSRTPLRILRQILSQVEQKRMALMENVYKAMEKKVRLEQESGRKGKDDYAERLRKIRIQKIAGELGNSVLYIEGALKEIGFLMGVYEEIRTNNNIPENWDETDVEAAEAEHHAKQAILQAYREVLSTPGGTIGQGNMEYLEQVGIHPFAAMELIRNYIAASRDEFARTEELPGIDELYDFVDHVYEQYKGSHRKVLDRVGINLINENVFRYEDPNRNKERNQ